MQRMKESIYSKEFEKNYENFEKYFIHHLENRFFFKPKQRLKNIVTEKIKSNRQTRNEGRTTQPQELALTILKAWLSRRYIIVGSLVWLCFIGVLHSQETTDYDIPREQQVSELEHASDQTGN